MKRLVPPDSAAPRVTIVLDGRAVAAVEGETLAGLMFLEGIHVFRRMPDGAPRGPYCGMGTCFECRVVVATPGAAPLTVRACMTPAREGMIVSTTGEASVERSKR